MANKDALVKAGRALGQAISPSVGDTLDVAALYREDDGQKIVNRVLQYYSQTQIKIPKPVYALIIETDSTTGDDALSGWIAFFLGLCMEDKPIRQKRKDRGVTQQQLADAIGSTQASIARWETGKANPDTASLKKLALYFGCRIDELIEK